MKINVTNGFVLIERSVLVENITTIHFCNNEVLGGKLIACNKAELKVNIERFIDILTNTDIESITINKCTINMSQLHDITVELMNIYSE